MFLDNGKIWWALAVPLALGGGGCGSPQAPKSEPSAARPNIVLVMADDQGWGDVGFHGNPVLKTPNLDELARSGLRFDRFYAAAPVCSPTRGSVMTGRHPNRFGCFSWGHTLRPQEVTLAEALKAGGYRTGHFGKWHLGSVRTGSPVNPGASGFDEWVSSPNFFDNDPILSKRGRAVPMQGESSMVTVDLALEFIRSSVGGPDPFFAVVWFGSPHRPHQAYEEDRAFYSNEPEEIQHYFGEITAMDRAVGKLRRELRSLGIGKRTIFWYCSDNGALPEGSNGNFRGIKAELYEGGLLVPAVLEWPDRIREPRITEFRATTSDIFPTLLAITGITTDENRPLDGVSLLPLIDGDVEERPVPIGFWNHPTPGISTPAKQWMEELAAAQADGHEPNDTAKLRLDAAEVGAGYPDDRFPGHAAWTDGDWKLHRIADESGGLVELELYDLRNDPSESRNLADIETQKTLQMKTALEEWLRSVVHSLNGEEY